MTSIFAPQAFEWFTASTPSGNAVGIKRDAVLGFEEQYSGTKVYLSAGCIDIQQRVAEFRAWLWRKAP